MTEEELMEIGADLLEALRRGIPKGYKSRYRRNIWQQFEDAVVNATYTNSLSRFVSRFCQAFDSDPGGSSAERNKVLEVMQSGLDRELLRLLRRETTLVVLMARVRNERRREEWEREHDIEEAVEVYRTLEEDKPLFEGVE